MSWLSNQLNNLGISDNVQTGVLTAFNPMMGLNQMLGNPSGAVTDMVTDALGLTEGGGDSTNFNYNPATSEAPDLGFLNQAMGQMGGQAGLMNQTAQGLTGFGNQMFGSAQGLYGQGQNFIDQGQSFADGTNPMYARMRQNMLGDLSSQATMGARQGAEALASMGAGSKGLRDIIAGKQSNTAMQQLGSGYESMLDQGLGLATTYGQMGMQGMQGGLQGMQGAGSLLNMAGGLQQGAGGLYQGAGNLGMAGANLNQQNQMFNADAQNQATQFGLSGGYQSMFNEQAREDDMFNNMLSIGASLAPALISTMSDKRIKHDIKHVGHYGKYPVYTYRYNHAPNTEFTGVMAQDVEKINPEAVTEIDGIKRVNYSMLGE
tara:strand:- start:432 stop:1556 length:1125 start_codon:yes stop_codon:yes gene_type:complete